MVVCGNCAHEFTTLAYRYTCKSIGNTNGVHHRLPVNNGIGHQFHGTICVNPTNSIEILGSVARRIIRRLIRALHSVVVIGIDNQLFVVYLIRLEVHSLGNGHIQHIGVGGFELQGDVAGSVATGSNHQPHRLGVGVVNHKGSCKGHIHAIHAVANHQGRNFHIGRLGGGQHKVGIGNCQRRTLRLDLHTLDGVALGLTTLIAQFKLHNAIHTTEAELYGRLLALHLIGLRLHHPQIFQVGIVTRLCLILECRKCNGNKVVHALVSQTYVGIVGAELVDAITFPTVHRKVGRSCQLSRAIFGNLANSIGVVATNRLARHGGRDTNLVAQFPSSSESLQLVLSEVNTSCCALHAKVYSVRSVATNHVVLQRLAANQHYSSNGL